MTKKPSMDEYNEIGYEFKQLNERILSLIITVEKKCGKKYSKELKNGLKKINQTRSDIEELMFKQYPEVANENIFYGDKSINISKIVSEFKPRR